MGIFSHVRTRFWDAERYTAAQAAELQQLRRLYLQYMAPAVGAELPPALQVEAEDEHRPTYRPGAAQAVPVVVGPFASTAHYLANVLRVFEQRRSAQWYGKGHSNDPVRLWAIYLRGVFSEWLAAAPCDGATLKQVTALRHYLEAVQRERVLPESSHLEELLYNSTRALTQVEERVQADIRLRGAREHFTDLKTGVATALQQAVEYFFYAFADTPRTVYAFSLEAVSAGTVDTRLQANLSTREGLAIQHTVHRILALQDSLPTQSTRPPLLLENSEPSLLEATGQVDATWLAFLQHEAALQAQLAPSLQRFPVGICPLLHTPNIQRAFLRCLGLTVTLAHYHHYLEKCWKLAGYGGDHLVYDRLAEAVTTVLQEWTVFATALQENVRHFQQSLDSSYAEALRSPGQHAHWKRNYGKAKASAETLQQQLAYCQTLVRPIQDHIRNTEIQTSRLQGAQSAAQSLQGATDFLNTARRQIGLTPPAIYPGLEQLASRPLLLGSARLRFDPLLTTLLPGEASSVRRLSKLCILTPRSLPWTGFKGEYRRACYLQNTDRLWELGESLAQLHNNPALLASSEGRRLLDRTRQALQEEQIRITRLSKGLWWPFHRASRHFFALWQAAVVSGLTQLHTLETRPLPETLIRSEDEEAKAALTPADTLSIQVITRQLQTSRAGMLGVSTAPDVTDAEAEKDGAEQMWERAQAALARADSALAKALGTEPNNPLSLTAATDPLPEERHAEQSTTQLTL